MRPRPGPRDAAIRRTLVRTAPSALTGLATLAAGLVLASPADAGNRVTPGQLHRLRLRPVHGADPEAPWTPG